MHIVLADGTYTRHFLTFVFQDSLVQYKSKPIKFNEGKQEYFDAVVACCY